MTVFIDIHHLREDLLELIKNDVNKESNPSVSTLNMFYNSTEQELYCIMDSVDESSLREHHQRLGLKCDFVMDVEHIHTKTLQNTERLRAIGELAARLAHDLRNPLSVIKNTVEIMEYKQRLSIEDRVIYFGRLHRAIDRISHQIEDVLDFVRPIELSLKKNLLNEIISSAIEKITLPDLIKITVPTNFAYAICDFTKMEVTLTNLIMNAIQAMNNKGHISITLHDDPKFTTIKISDTGSGMPQEIIPRIFDPLFTTKQEGTGLGLASCKKIIEQHGGVIDVASETGKGTVFTITLPKIVKSHQSTQNQKTIYEKPIR